MSKHFEYLTIIFHESFVSVTFWLGKKVRTDDCKSD